MKHFSRLSPFLVSLVGFAALAVYVQPPAAQAQIRIVIKPSKPKPPPPTPATPKPPVGEKPAPPNGGQRTAPQIEMVRIPGGSFLMGSPANEAGRFDAEGPQHRVTVPSFSIGKFEVTQAQWRAVMGTNPSFFQGRFYKGKSDDLPVETVSWNEAKEFCRRLSQMTGKAYRLPTEAEWEYAARAGTTGAFAGEIDAMAWHSLGFDGTTHPVGQKKANAFGLHDMHGNVEEWCEDTWHNNYKGAPTDGSAWLDGGFTNYQVVRGGSWTVKASHCRSATRTHIAPGGGGMIIGFRVVIGARTQ
jgi:eukaryotic-like serine/threonine-protein kinase